MAKRLASSRAPGPGKSPDSRPPRPGPTPLATGLLLEICAEFPDFEILPKRGSALQRAIHHLLVVLTLGGQRVYLTRYHTVMFGKLWVPDSWERMADADRYILLRHERVHLRQRARMGDLVMAFVYLVPFFPLGLAWGRARIEWEAYVETIRATAEIFGGPAAERLRPEIVRRFTSADYGWMWPFPRMVSAWFDEAMGEVLRELRELEEASRDR